MTPTSCQSSPDAGSQAVGQKISEKYGKVPAIIKRKRCSRRHRRHRRQQRKISARKILKSPVRDGGNPSVEPYHRLNKDLCKNDPEQEDGTLLNARVSSSDLATSGTQHGQDLSNLQRSYY
ncbi:hypothetical protein HispidOSU_011018 [Sigmodon hispidus]